MAKQTILFTVMPRGLRVNPGTLPVSVAVNPRLYDGNKLGQFPDWLDWTTRLHEHGLKITLRCGSKKRTFEIDLGVLRPDLWKAMFDSETFVRSHVYKDYSSWTIFSYPVRLALSMLKSTYQEAGLVLGVPDRSSQEGAEGRGYSLYRLFLRSLMAGYAVNWNHDRGEALRSQYRDGFSQLGTAGTGAPGGAQGGIVGIGAQYNAAALAPDGTLSTIAPAPNAGTTALHQFVSQQFALCSHLPAGAPVHDNPPDFDKLIDFHQALSSLNSYPELLRALGLVFDLDLPADFVATTPIGTPGRLAVIDLPGHAWDISTQAPPTLAPLETAYTYFSVGSPALAIFTTAPGLLGGILPDLEMLGLLNLDPTRFGLAQVDVESAMNKTIMLAEGWQDDRPAPALPDHPDVFDETTTLPSLRSGGFSLFADGRALRLLKNFQDSKQFNMDLESNAKPKRPFYAEDLVHGYRVDIWDSFTNEWHSLHRRMASYTIGKLTFAPEDEVEGFTQLAAAQSAPDPDNPPADDLYLNESVARWAGWSLSVPFPGKALSRDVDPDNALVEDPDHPQNEPATPFKMTTQFSRVAGSLPALRFGRRYRLRLRTVDLAGNSMGHNDPIANLLAFLTGLPRDGEGFAFLRYEPVAAPTVVLKDASGVTAPGSQLNRLVIRTHNADPSQDGAPADLTGSERHIVPPSTSVEMGERMGMFDQAGKIDAGAAMYKLIGARDKGKLNEISATVGGQTQTFPLETSDKIDSLPFLPDVLARGAALRDLPGSPDQSIALVQPGAGPAQPLPYQTLDAANPRPGSAALVSFGGEGDWQKLESFRLALADGEQAPQWDPAGRVLTIYLPKAKQATVPLSSYLYPDDLKLMGVWQWLREAVDLAAIFFPAVPIPDPRSDSERIEHLLQRSVEGGHWMITPPRILSLIHAVQQPVGHPEFRALSVQHVPYGTVYSGGYVNEVLNPDPKVLQTAPEARPTSGSELAAITAWRKPGSPEAYLLGGLKIHAASTEKIDLLAEWTDPTDDVSQPRLEGQDYRQAHNAQVDEIPVPGVQEGLIKTGAPGYRFLGYYDADHDLLCFARRMDKLGNLPSGVSIYTDAAPRHYLNDTRYHKITYTARATSRFREYFPPNAGLEFTRDSQPIEVDVPASDRPAAPQLSYIVPSFGWQRQTQTNLKRSVRFGGGLRVYLERPWFSSGDGELLGLALFDPSNGAIDREKWKSTVTQWGADPIWLGAGLQPLPHAGHFPNRAADEPSLSLPGRAPGRVAVAGFPVDFDYETQKWFADLTVDTQTLSYTPFLRIALVRYQPFALPDAKLSPVVLADYIQIAPERSAVISADPYHPRRLRLTVSGPAPTGPPPEITGVQPTDPVHVPSMVTITIQERDPAISTDLGWRDAPAGSATINPLPLLAVSLLRWSGTVDFSTAPKPGQFRVLIREYEYLSANYTIPTGLARARQSRREQPRRLVYAEAIEVDSALVGGPSDATGTTL
jgi:hypothetical protein